MKGKLYRLCFCFFAFAVSGCATTSNFNHTRFSNYLKTGQCNNAFLEVNNSNIEHDGGYEAMLYSIIYNDCLHNRAEAMFELNLAARYGIPEAQKMLVSIGQPVPAADLASNSNSAGSSGSSDLSDALLLLNAALDGFNKGMDKNNNSVSCTSTVMGSIISTNCD